MKKSTLFNPNKPDLTSKSLRIAVYITPDESCHRAIDVAAKLAEQNDDMEDFVAFYIVKPGKNVRQTQKKALEAVSNYAAKVGAHVEMITAFNPTYAISEYCKSRQVNLLVMNRPRNLSLAMLPTLVQRVSFFLPNTQLLSVPGDLSVNLPSLAPRDLKKEKSNLLWMFGILVLTMWVCFILDHFGVDEILLGEVVVLGVLVCSFTLKNWLWSILIAFLSLIFFNFLFTYPRFTFFFEEPAFFSIFIMTLICSLIGSFIGNQLHNESVRSAQSNKATQILLNATHLLKRAETPDQIIAVVAHKLSTITGKNVVYYPYTENGLEEKPILFPYSWDRPIDEEELKREYPAAIAATHLGSSGISATGSLTNYCFDSHYMYSPFISRSRLYGVIGIRLSQETVDPLDLMMLTSIIAEGVLSYEAKLKDIELQRIEMKAENDALRSNLLKALAHDIRTPLTSIIGNITTLQERWPEMTYKERQETFDTVQNDSLNLYSMVENLLTAARIDGETKMDIKKNLDIVSDVVEAGMKYPLMANRTHPIEVIESDEDDILACYMDSSLISQVVTNIVLNAIYHTPEGTPIEVRMFEDNGYAVVEVADQGLGIAPEVKKRVFDIFYTGEAPSFDSNSTLGLGLFLCREIIEAHNGLIDVRDNTPSGSIFSFRLPLAELSEVLPQDF